MSQSNSVPRFPRKAYRLLAALRRIGNLDDAERIAELRREIGDYWARWSDSTASQQAILREFVDLRFRMEEEKRKHA